MVKTIVCTVLFSLASTGIASDGDANHFWDQVVANALEPAEGKFVVEIKRTKDAHTEPKRMQTVIEYWLRGRNLRFDVTDKEGRDLHSQVVLLDQGETILHNLDRQSPRVIVGESRRGVKISDDTRINWLYFQTLLGRFPFHPLALYEESFDEFRDMGRNGSASLVTHGDSKTLSFAFPNGRSIVYYFGDFSLDPHKIEIRGVDGIVSCRQLVEWRLLPKKNKQFPYSGSLEYIDSTGEITQRYDWRHSSFGEISSADNPFSWKAMSLVEGKKLVITESEGMDRSGGYWNGSAFTVSPLATPRSSYRTIVMWLSIFGLVSVAVLVFSKVYLKIKGS